jgi:hypothetical protein
MKKLYAFNPTARCYGGGHTLEDNMFHKYIITGALVDGEKVLPDEYLAFLIEADADDYYTTPRKAKDAWEKRYREIPDKVGYYFAGKV